MTTKKCNDLIFEYLCANRYSEIVDAMLKQNMGRVNDERYVFYQIHQKMENVIEDETEFYESLEKELLGLMKKYVKVLNEDTKMKAMNMCIETRLQCVLCKLRVKKIDFKVFKNGIDKFFPDAEQTTPEYPGIEQFMATVTYTKTRDTLMKCISHGKGNDFIVKYAKSFFNDAFYVDTFKKKVIDLLTNIENDAKGAPGLITMVGEPDDAEIKGLISIASIVAKGHGSPIVVAPPPSGKKRKTLSTSSSTNSSNTDNSSNKTKKQKTNKKKKKAAPLEESASSQTTTQDEDVEEPISEESPPPPRRSARKAKKKSQDEKENAPQSTSSSRSVKKRKAIAHKEESVVKELKKARAKVAKNDPIDLIVPKASRINKSGGEELEWTQTSVSKASDGEEDEEEVEDDGRGKGPTPKKRGEEKFEAKKVKKKLDYKKPSFTTTTTTTTSKKKSKKKKTKGGRKRVAWSKIEEEYLIAGVEKYKSSWATILDTYEFDEHRTNVHLKDKWRNLVKKNPDLASKMD